MYAGVPSEIPALVNVPCGCSLRSRAVATALATPKSATMAAPPASRTLSGLMSRCTIPRSCAKARARATSRRMLTVIGTESARSLVRRARSDSPSTNGITKYGSPSASPAAITPTMLGCCRLAEVRISRRNRSRDSPSAMSSRSTLTTTSRASDPSCARNTRDIPPPPISRSMRYACPSARCTRSATPSVAGGGDEGLVMGCYFDTRATGRDCPVGDRQRRARASCSPSCGANGGVQRYVRARGGRYARAPRARLPHIP